MNLSKLAVVVASTLVLAACDSDNNNRSQVPEPGISQLQVLHASADAPAVNVSFNGQQVLSNVDYKQGSARLTISEGTYPVRVDGIIGKTLAKVGFKDGKDNDSSKIKNYC